MINNLEKAYFAGGCFWGIEYYFQKLKGAISTQVGYIGGKTKNPTYKQVCGGKTGHAEAVEIIFDNEKISFENLAKLFFEIHDPTQVNRQESSISNQYRSEIFYTNKKQKTVAQKLIDILNKKGYKTTTQLTKATNFWKAEKYHQRYYTNNKSQLCCHKREKRFK